MNQAIPALLGAITGFFLPLIASYVRSRTRGSRFENAVRAEIDEAKNSVHQKMLWLSRDQMPYRSQIEERLLIEFEGHLLYLGEPEDLSTALPFWDHNLRDVIEATSTRAFNRMCREVSLLRKFESKFREMKLAFQTGGGDPKQMALACYRDLIQIHDSLIATSQR
jgi:hypothetical protein